MLVLSRKPGQRIVLSNGVTITIVETAGNKVRLGIDAPRNVAIWREELQHEIDRRQTVESVDSLASDVGNPLPTLESHPAFPLL